MMQHFNRRSFLRCGAASVVPLVISSQNVAAQTAVKQSDLELIYARWRGALKQQNATEWLKLTSRYRQMAIRNEVVSAGLEWPRAVFRLALQPPDIIPLKALQTKADGVNARIVYYGQADFGIKDVSAPNNLLLLWFLKDGAEWKFNTAQYVNLSTDEARLAASKGDLSVLNDVEEFQINPLYPEIPKPCEEPYHVGKVNVVSLGWKIKVHVNGAPHVTLTDTASSKIIIGGVRKGPNRIAFEAIPTTQDATKRKLEVTVTMPSGTPGLPERELYKFAPAEGEIPKPVDANFFGPSKSVVR